MPGVNQVQPRQGPLKTILPMAGQALGSAFGGPVGGAVGGMVGEKLAGEAPEVAPVQSTAMQRRFEATAPEVPHAETLAAADQALAQLPAQYQQQYGPTLAAAKAKQQTGDFNGAGRY